MKAELNTKFELREKVYAVRGGRIYYGEIAEIHLSANRIHREWVVHYDLQDAIYNIPERAIYRTLGEAEKVFNKWSSFKDRTRVEMSEKEHPRKSSGVRYVVTDDGTIV